LKIAAHEKIARGFHVKISDYNPKWEAIMSTVPTALLATCQDERGSFERRSDGRRRRQVASPWYGSADNAEEIVPTK